MRLPDEIKDTALTYVYEVFDRKRWEQVPASKRGAVYDELIADEKSEPRYWALWAGVVLGDRGKALAGLKQRLLDIV